MTMTRRQLLMSAIGVTGATMAGLAWRATDRNILPSCEGGAYQPWCGWPRGTGLMFAASAAILAASPHNTQPWQFRITNNRVDLFADAKRTIGTIDPLLREQHIGTGCALENLLLAGEYAGFGVRELNYDPNPATEKIASATFEPRPAQQSVLCRAIPHRHTNRGPYQSNRTIPADLIHEMERLNREAEIIQLKMWTDPPSHQRIKELIIAASEAIVADREQSRDSARWYRGTPNVIERQRDGITLDAQGLSPIMTAFAKWLPEPSPSMADQVFLNRTKTVHCGPGASFGTIVARERVGKEVRVCVGQLWERMHLWATAHELAMQPLNQVHERIDREATSQIPPKFTHDLASLVGESNWRGVFTFRMGYAVSPGKPSPRRDLAQFLTSVQARGVVGNVFGTAGSAMIT